VLLVLPRTGLLKCKLEIMFEAALNNKFQNASLEPGTKISTKDIFYISSLDKKY
jgi:hypothetical protein